MGRYLLSVPSFLLIAAGNGWAGELPPWKAPAEAAGTKNPQPATAESIARGRKVFIRECLTCHGAKGKGDGPAASGLERKPGNLADPKTWLQTEGEIFWKVTQGRKPMPTWGQILSEQDRWHVINYERTLAMPNSKKEEVKKERVEKSGPDGKEKEPQATKKPDEIRIERGGIAGRVTWAGDIPKPVLLEITGKPQDLGVCASKPGEKTKPSPRLVVDGESKGVAWTVVTVEGVPQEAAVPFPERDVVVDQKCCAYRPHVVWIECGKSLSLKNSDSTLHNVHAKSEEGSVFNVAMPERDMAVKKKLRSPGLLSLGCDAGHIWMSAYVFVMDHPYVAITDAGGAFSIEGIPAGRYKVNFWHEGWEVTPIRYGQTGELSAYRYSEPVSHTLEVEVGAGRATEIGVSLGVSGFGK